MTPHKHADLIKAWADGAEIEERPRNGIWYTFDGGFWADSDEYEYRIKPEEKKPVKRWLWLMHDDACMNPLPTIATVYRTEQEAAEFYGTFEHKKLPWSEMEFEE